MDKIYNPKQIESNYYKTWEERGYFEVDYNKEKNFCIMMPPPNVTGSLHIGHAPTNRFNIIIYEKISKMITFYLDQ